VPTTIMETTQVKPAAVFYLKNTFNAPIAKALQVAGYKVLVYDYRGWGSSDPPPHSRIQRHDDERLPEARVQACSAGRRYSCSNSVLEIVGRRRRRTTRALGHGSRGGASLIAASTNPFVQAVIGAFPWLSGIRIRSIYP
jgi:pimeloyl-ACP methyl ester carboxylesterase